MQLQNNRHNSSENVIIHLRRAKLLANEFLVAGATVFPKISNATIYNNLGGDDREVVVALAV